MIDYLSATQNTLIRIDTVLSHRIGQIYNNESLIMTNGIVKANASVRLSLARDYDIGVTSLMYHSSNGSYYPLEIRLAEAYGDIDYRYEKGSAVKSFIKDDKDLDASASEAIWEKVKEIRKKSYKLPKSPIGVFERLAFKYREIMNLGIDYANKEVVARLELYESLVRLDDRYSGVNVEEAMLIRKEEHDTSLMENSNEKLTYFIAQCVFDGITRAADQIFELRQLGEYAVLFLSLKMERGREYTFDELSALFSLDKELMKALFIIPALSSDRVSIGNAGDGDETLTLIG